VWVSRGGESVGELQMTHANTANCQVQTRSVLSSGQTPRGPSDDIRHEWKPPAIYEA